MPHIFDPPSMETICYKSIADNMDSYWCTHFYKSLHGKGDFMYVMGPFSDMPAPLLSRLIEFLCRNHQLKPTQLQLLLQPKLREFTLTDQTSGSGEVPAGVLHTVAVRCSGLVRLNLTGNARMPLQALVQLFSSLPHVEEVDLSRTSASDRVLSVIGARCPRLQSLNVTYTLVGDLGVSALCCSFQAPLEQQPTKPCAGDSLVSLLVEGSRIHALDSCVTAMVHMKSLRIFDHPRSIESVHKMLKTSIYPASAIMSSGEEKTEHWTLPLTYLQGECGEALEPVLSVCPQVERLKLDIRTGYIRPLLVLKHLTTLSLSLVDLPNQAPSTPELRQLLNTIGHQLHQLTLINMVRVPIDSLVFSCPLLTELQLLVCSYSSSFLEPSHSAEKDLASSLKRLCLVQEDGVDVPIELVEPLLASASLEDVQLVNCEVLNDPLVEHLLERRCLRQLRSARIESCDHVDFEAVQRIVCGCPLISKLDLLGCAQITRRHADQLQTLSDANGWRIDITWD